jgi:hypothetical protein
MKQTLKLLILTVLITVFSCKERTTNIKFKTVSLLNNRIKLDIPITWKNLNPRNSNFYQDTLNEVIYGKKLREEQVSIMRVDEKEEDLNILLKNELIMLREVKQPWSKIIETKIDHKNKTITIKTTLHLKNDNDYTEIYWIIKKQERFYVFFVGKDTQEYRQNIQKMVNSIKVI